METFVTLPAGSWTSVLAGDAPITGTVALGDVLNTLPVAVLERQ
jgi:maltooligosyltrehalose synthase